MIGQTIGELLTEHVTLDVEGIDRLYLNAYQPRLQTGGEVAYFFRQHRGAKVASTLLMAPMSQAFVTAIANFAATEEIDMVHFRKHQSKDEETQRRLKAAPLLREGVLYIGVAQEKFSTFRVSKKHNPLTGHSFPWLSPADVMCNQYYFYVVDEDFGPCSSNSLPTFPTPPASISTGMSSPSASWPRRGLPLRRWTTVCSGARTRPPCKGYWTV